MMYEQTLWKEIKDVVNPKILKKQNRFKKWVYGYNKEYDFIVISKTGKIGKIIEIQNLRIALPAEFDCYKKSEKKSEQYWEQAEYPKELKRAHANQELKVINYSRCPFIILIKDHLNNSYS